MNRLYFKSQFYQQNNLSIGIASCTLDTAKKHYLSPEEHMIRQGLKMSVEKSICIGYIFSNPGMAKVPKAMTLPLTELQ